MEKEILLTQAGYDDLVKELDYLKTEKRAEIAEKIKVARGFGDLSENSEYDEAKTEQGKLYSKIAEIKKLIENAEIIEKVVGTTAVALSSSVKVRDLDGDFVEEYKIVGSQEANPMQGRISGDSPFGRALLGRHVGEIVSVEAPAGELRFEILEIEN